MRVSLAPVNDAIDHRVVGLTRARVGVELQRVGREDLIDDAQLVLTELVTNALLHGGGCTGVYAIAGKAGVRLEVADGSRVPPLFAHPTAESMTGRGLRLVARLSDAWGVEPIDGGKIVWAEVSGRPLPASTVDEDDLLAMWDDDWDWDHAPRFHVSLGDVPTSLLLDAKAHIDNLVREFTLAASGARAGLTATVPAHLASLIETVVHRFDEVRRAIRRQASEAAGRGDELTHLELELTADAAAAGQEYLHALDEVDAYCRAMRLLTLETPPEHRVFRRWYVEEIIAQLRKATGRQQ
jgi:anti-sigma regulatory factor (Ser/Thr protein kinase)